MKILVINPGSTSTKLAVFDDFDLLKEETIRHSVDELAEYPNLYEQRHFREKLIRDFLESAGFDLDHFDAIIGRGGLLRPLRGGTYCVTESMIEDLRSCRYGEHASNLGAILARELSRDSGKEIPSFIADPVVVDEMDDLARFSGHPDFKRRSILHALNHKSVGRQVASMHGIRYEELNLIVVHMGGGISIGAHKKGKIVDVNNALNGDGPYTPERSGTLPLTQLIKLCYSGKYSKQEIKELIKGRGGMVAYTGTSDCLEVQKAIDAGNKEWELYYRGMAYQIVKWIGRMAAVLRGEVDYIVLTGGLAYDSEHMVRWIEEKVSFIAPVEVIPGGSEEEALAAAALRVLKKQEEPRIYEESTGV